MTPEDMRNDDYDPEEEVPWDCDRSTSDDYEEGDDEGDDD